MAPHDDNSSTASESGSDELIALDMTRLKVKESNKHIICTSEGGAAGHSLTAGSCVEQPSTASMDPPAGPLLVGILKQPRYSSSVTSKQEGPIDAPSSDDFEVDDAQPAHWPALRQSVHFINGNTSSPSQSVVTSIIYRPYTEPEEVSELYYTSEDFNLFKREYRALLKAQHRRRQGIAISKSDEAKNNRGLKETSSSVGGGSLFSSVFDVAKEAVNLFSGSANYSYHQNQISPQNKARQQHQLLLDTMYSNLF
jgi:hypothetical protein